MAAAFDGYGRVSRTGDRDTDSQRFHSTALQQETVEAWLARNGFRVGMWVEDLNLSGGRRRPQLEQLVARVESGISAGVAVYNLSRFSRETLLGLADIDRIVAAGGRFVAVNDGVDTADPNWRLNATIRLAIDSDYLRRTKDGFRQVRERLVAMGVHVTNWDNVGYVRREDLRYEPHPAYGPVMAEAFKMRAAGRSLRQIADLLAAEHVVSGRAVAEKRTDRRQTWTTGGVLTILKRPVYLGWAYWGKVPSAGPMQFRYVNRDAHVALTDPETFAEANKPRAERRPRKVAAHLDRYLLRGLVRCAACSHTMKPDRYTDRGRDIPMYRCRKRHQNGRCPAPVAIDARNVEAHTIDVVLAALGREGAAGRTPHAELDIHRQRVREAEIELAGYLRVARATLPGFEEGLVERERALEDAKRVLAAHQGARVVGHPTVVVAEELWPTLTREQQRALLGGALDFVLIRGSIATDGRRRAVAERVGVVWSGQAEPNLSRPGFSAEVRPYPYPWDDADRLPQHSRPPLLDDGDQRSTEARVG